MKYRFDGGMGQQALLSALKQQKLIAGNATLAKEVAAIGEVQELATGTVIIQQGNQDSDIFLILEGSLDIVVDNKVVANRARHDHVGERVAIQPTSKRSATVVAREPSTVLKLSEPQFRELSSKHPQMLLYIAREFAARLEQRNARVNDLFGMV